MDIKSKFFNLLDRGESESAVTWLRDACSEKSSKAAEVLQSEILDPIGWYMKQPGYVNTSELIELFEIVSTIHRRLDRKISIWPEQINMLEEKWLKFQAAMSALISPLANTISSLKPLADHGRKMEQGKLKGAYGPIRKAIRLVLEKNPALLEKASAECNEDLWQRIKKNPPRGWVLVEKTPYTPRRCEAPAGAMDISYDSFKIYASRERGLLKKAQI